MAEVLTDLERRVLDYLVEYLRTNTYQPSVREIGRTFSIKSTKTVSELLQSLADKGWVERDPSRSRGVRLLGVELRNTISVPLQHTAEAQRDAGLDALEIDQRIASRGTFLVVMPDDGLRDRGIQAGDLLLVEPVDADILDAGDVVLAATPSGRVVRRYNDEHGPTLEPNAVHSAPIRVSNGAAGIEGRVISVVRRLRAPATSPVAAS